MTISSCASQSHMKMSLRKSNKYAGWAAYNPKQQQIQGVEADAENDPYPPISSTVISLHCPDRVKNIQARSFSSVIAPSATFPTLRASKAIEKPLLIGTSSTNWTNKVIKEKQGNNVYQSYEKLKELHSWADKSLIKDIMEAVNNDIDKASDLLKAMVSSNSLEANKKTNISYFEYDAENIHLENNTFLADKDLSLRETEDLLGFSYAREDELIFKNKGLIDDHPASGKTHPDHSAPKMQILGSLTYMPVEPEWEEDDVYLIHRKDAMRMMRYIISITNVGIYSGFISLIDLIRYVIIIFMFIGII